MSFTFLRSLPVERPAGPLKGYKLAYPMLSADGRSAGFGGIWSSGQAVYRLQDAAVCFWNHRHSPPKRRCSCGFYCLHSFDAARSMACEEDYRSTVILDVDVAGRFVRYEEGFRYSNQRVLGVRTTRCLCGRPASELVDSGTGTRGWVRLRPSCPLCRGPREPITLSHFGILLGDAGVVVEPAGHREDGPPASRVRDLPNPGDGPDQPALSLLAAEVALLQARVDSLQAQLARLSE